MKHPVRNAVSLFLLTLAVAGYAVAQNDVATRGAPAASTLASSLDANTQRGGA